MFNSLHQALALRSVGQFHAGCNCHVGGRWCAIAVIGYFGGFGMYFMIAVESNNGASGALVFFSHTSNADGAKSSLIHSCNSMHKQRRTIVRTIRSVQTSNINLQTVSKFNK